MRKGSYIQLFLASFLIVCLLGLAALLALSDSTPSASETESSVSAVIESESDLSQVLTPAETVTTLSETETDTETAFVPDHTFLFVGDSRTVGMQDALLKEGIEDGCSFIAQSGEGFYWLSNTAIDQLEAALWENPSATVIFNLGVNDLENVENYLAFYEDLFSSYPDAYFYLLSVNPVDDDECSGASNAEIEAFNDCLEEAFPDKYLDCYNYLLSQDFATADGLHYPDRIYLMIHDYVVDVLSSQ